MPSARAIAKGLAIGLGGLLAVVVAAGALGYAWLQSDGGRAWLVRQIEAAASTPGEMTLKIGALDGSLPAHLRVRDIVVSDPAGAWLKVARLDLDWQPWDLLDRTLQVEALDLKGVDVARLPAAPAPAAETQAGDSVPRDLLNFPLKVRIGRLTADRIDLGQPVLGEAASFTLSGEADRHHDGSSTARLDLVRLDGPEARLLTTLAYRPQDDTLSVEVDASEAPDGLVATLLGLPDLPRAELHLAGSGPLAKWDGKFSLSLGTLASANADIGLRRADTGDLGFHVTGRTTITAPDEAAVWRLAAGQTDVTLQGVWQQAGRLRLDRLEVANAAASLTASGSVEPASGTLDMKLTAATRQGAALAKLLDLDRLDAVSADVTATGTLNAPQAQVALQADGIASPDIQVKSFTAAGRATAQGDLLGPSPVLALDLKGRLDAPRLPGENEINQVLGAQLPWSLAGTLDLNSARLDIAKLEATPDAASVSATGTAQLDDGTAKLDSVVQVADLAALQPLTDIRLGGQAKLTGPVEIARFGGHLSAELQGRWEQPSSEIALIGAAAGKGMDLSARVTLDGPTVRIEEATARSAVSSLTAAATVAQHGELRDGSYSLTVANAAALSDALGVAVAGRASAEGTMAGPSRALDLNGTAKLEKLQVAGQTLTNLAGAYQLRLNGPDIDGPVSVTLDSPFGHGEAHADLSLRSDSLTLAGLQAKLPEATASGKVTLPLAGGAPAADLRAEVGDLDPWLRLAGLTGHGKGKVTVRMNQPGTAAPLVASADLSGITLVPQPGAPEVSAARVTLAVQAQDPALQKPADIKLGADKLHWNRLDLARLDLDGKGTMGDLAVKLAGKGKWIEPLQISADGRVSQQGDIFTVALDRLDGQALGRPLTLKQPARLTLAPAETRLEDLDLASGKARLTADAKLGDKEIAVKAALDALPLKAVDGVWDTGVEGTVSAKLEVAGPRDAPHGTASLTSSGLRPQGSKDLPALDLTAQADWRDGRLKLNGQLGGAKVAAARFEADAPLQMAPDGGFTVPDTAPLSGRLQWSGDIRTALLFVPLPQNHLSGDAVIDLTVAGTPATPQLDGKVTLDKGRYENLETGTVLRNLQLAARLSGDKVTLTSLTADDGAGGHLVGKGGLTVDPAEAFPFDVTIGLDKLRAVRRDDVTAVASGKVTIDGDMKAPKITGRITTQTVEISLLAQLPPNVVSLDVTEVKNGEVVTPPQQEAKKAPPVDPELDIVIDMPRRVFVRGRGLDSEWAGKISVQGKASKPVISGQVNLVRGQISVVGKDFTLKDGKVVLPESTNAEPTLDVTAVHKGKDLEVTAELIGPLSKPELKLSSSPEVPKDEILSRVLFGKSASSLSAAEAAQLALALHDLTGNGGGPDILGFARRTLGVDVLRIDSGEGDKPAVEAGKYLNDRVYLGVKQGATAQSSSAGVQVEITPNVTVESEVTGSGANKSSLRFQLDY